MFQIVLLRTTRDLAEQLVKDSESLLRVAHQEEGGHMHITVECVSISAKMLSTAIRTTSEEVSDGARALAYVDVVSVRRVSCICRALIRLVWPSTAQIPAGPPIASRRPYCCSRFYGAHWQVIDPLNAWIMTDYARMNDAIEKLHERKWDVDKAKEQSAK